MGPATNNQVDLARMIPFSQAEERALSNAEQPTPSTQLVVGSSDGFNDHSALSDFAIHLQMQTHTTPEEINVAPAPLGMPLAPNPVHLNQPYVPTLQQQINSAVEQDNMSNQLMANPLLLRFKQGQQGAPFFPTGIKAGLPNKVTNSSLDEQLVGGDLGSFALDNLFVQNMGLPLVEQDTPQTWPIRAQPGPSTLLSGITEYPQQQLPPKVGAMSLPTMSLQQGVPPPSDDVITPESIREVSEESVTTRPRVVSNVRQQEQSPTSPPKKVRSPGAGVSAVIKPLSAYNFFFSEERERLLLGGKGGLANCLEGMAARKQRLLAQHLAKDRTKRRPHRKTHGKISFTSLSKVIGQKWRELPEADKKFYRDVARADLERYKKDLESFRETNEA